MEKRIFVKGIIGYLLLLPVMFFMVLSVDVQAIPNFINGTLNDTTGWVVTGKVTDERGKPLKGAVVFIKDKNTGGRTDGKGRFFVNADSNDILLFSYVGKEMRSIPVARQKVMEVRLYRAVWVLEDSYPVVCVKEKTDEVFEPIEVMPEFPGDVFVWISGRIKYPEKAYEKRIEGEVQISFAIDKRGRVKRVNVVRSTDVLLEREAIRVVKAMPRWKPAKQNRKNVEIECLIPVSFLLK